MSPQKVLAAPMPQTVKDTLSKNRAAKKRANRPASVKSEAARGPSSPIVQFSSADLHLLGASIAQALPGVGGPRRDMYADVAEKAYHAERYDQEGTHDTCGPVFAKAFGAEAVSAKRSTINERIELLHGRIDALSTLVKLGREKLNTVLIPKPESDIPSAAGTSEGVTTLVDSQLHGLDVRLNHLYYSLDQLITEIAL